MSFTDTRDELALALSGVPGIRGYQRRPQALDQGDGFVLLGRAVRGPGDSWECRWRVLVYLGGDGDTATTFLDEKLPLLVAAVDPVAYVDAAQPIEIPVDGNAGFFVELTAKSE